GACIELVIIASQAVGFMLRLQIPLSRDRWVTTPTRLRNSRPLRTCVNWRVAALSSYRSGASPAFASSNANSGTWSGRSTTCSTVSAPVCFCSQPGNQVPANPSAGAYLSFCCPGIKSQMLSANEKVVGQFDTEIGPLAISKPGMAPPYAFARLTLPVALQPCGQRTVNAPSTGSRNCSRGILGSTEKDPTTCPKTGASDCTWSRGA